MEHSYDLEEQELSHSIFLHSLLNPPINWNDPLLVVTQDIYWCMTDSSSGATSSSIPPTEEEKAATTLGSLFRNYLWKKKRKMSSSRPTNPNTGATAGTKCAGNTVVKFGGFDCTIVPDESNKTTAIVTNNGCLFELKNRPGPDSNEYRKIIDFALKTFIEPKFSRNTASLDDISSLKNVNDLHNQTEQLKAFLNMIGITCIFNVLYPANIARNSALTQVPDPTSATAGATVNRSTNLFSNHGLVTKREVGLSNQYWKKYMYYKDKDGKERSLQAEMVISFHVIQNHMEANLRDACLREYNACPPEDQGGPLLYKIMMTHLLEGNEVAMQSLISTLTKYNVAVDAKDDVRLAVSTIKAASDAIIAMRDDTKTDQFPPGFVEKIIKVLCTTSCELYNEKINSLLKDAEHQRKLGGTPVLTNDEAGIDKVLNYSTTTVSDLERDGTWVVAMSPNQASSFVASDNDCFNCGEKGCTPTKCKEKGVPVDKARVKANRENSKKSKQKKKKPRPHKWRLPESQENGRRTIDGKLYKWNATKEFWEEVSAPESGLQPSTDIASGNTAAPTISTATVGPVPSSVSTAEAVTLDDSDTAAKIQLQLANLLNNTSQIRDAVL